MVGSSARYTFTSSRDLDVSSVISLYESVGWIAYTCRPEIFPTMLASASHVVAAQAGAGLVGLVRVVGDGVSVAVIQDLLVHPDHQGQGLGGELLQRALSATNAVRQTYITTDDTADNRHVIAFYERHGFMLNGLRGLVTLSLFRQPDSV